MKIISDLLKEKSPVVIIIIAGILAGGAWFFFQTRVVWGYFLISVAIAYLLGGTVNRLSSMGLSRSLSVFFSFAIIISILIVFLMILIPRLGLQINKFAKDFPDYVSQAQVHFESLEERLNESSLPPDVKKMPDKFWEGFQQYGVSILQKAVQRITGFFSQILAFIIIPIATFYLLKDVHKFRASFLNLFSIEQRENVEVLLSRLDTALGGFIRSRLKLCLLVGVGMTIGLTIFKVPYAGVLGLICGICEFVPYVGPLVGAIPTLLVGLISDKFSITLVIVLIVQVLENALFVPKIMGTEMGLHPLVVIMALLAGGELAGPGGMILSVPLVAAVKILAEYFMQRTRDAEMAEIAAAQEEQAAASKQPEPAAE